MNPVRAGLATTIETSDFTSVQRRIQALPGTETDRSKKGTSQPPRTKLSSGPARPSADRFLSPVKLNERSNAPIGPRAHQVGARCNDNGFLSISQSDYFLLLDWTARQLVRGKLGSTPDTVLPIFRRIRMEAPTWYTLVKKFGQMFRTVAGRPQTITATRSRVYQRRFNLGKQARDLLTAPE